MIELQRSGRHPNVYLFAGADAWHQAEHRRRTHGEGSVLVLPSDEQPEALTWPALDALVAIPGDCDGERFRWLIIELLTAGTRCVIEVRPDRAPVAHHAADCDAPGVQ